MRNSSPVPYAAFLKFNFDSNGITDEISVLCSSPERFIKINQSGLIESKPIKGTLPRGLTKAEDFDLKEKLKKSPKDFSENLMIVDLIRNDLGVSNPGSFNYLGRVCYPGSVCVTKLMEVESYSTVHQLVSSIQGQLLPDLKVSHALRASFPPGSMTGAPKVRSTDILHSLEIQRRGIYSGSIGYWSITGAADFNVVIRSAIMTQGAVSIGAGGALTHQSDPKDEFDEVLLKTKAVIGAILKTQHPDKNIEDLFANVQFDGCQSAFTPPVVQL